MNEQNTGRRPLRDRSVDTVRERKVAKPEWYKQLEGPGGFPPAPSNDGDHRPERPGWVFAIFAAGFFLGLVYDLYFSKILKEWYARDRKSA